MKHKIAVTVICSMLFAFVIFASIIFWYQENYNPTKIWAKSFYEYNNINEKKIFIIGNSHVGSIDQKMLQDSLLVEGYEFQVFNLSIGGDNPQKRLVIIDSLINLKPDLIVYGIDYRSFEASASQKDIQAVSSSKIQIKEIFPSFHNLFEEIFFSQLKDEIFSFVPESPKLITLRIMNNLIHNSSELERLDLNSKKPLITDEAVGIEKMDSEELQKWIDERRSFRGIPVLEQNVQLNDFKNILTKFNQNKIKFVVFTTPHHNTYLDYIQDKDKHTFNQIIDSVEKYYKIKIHRMDEKFKDAEIFANPTHVAVNSSKLYSNEIFEIIKSEIVS